MGNHIHIIISHWLIYWLSHSQSVILISSFDSVSKWTERLKSVIDWLIQNEVKNTLPLRHDSRVAKSKSKILVTIHSIIHVIQIHSLLSQSLIVIQSQWVTDWEWVVSQVVKIVKLQVLTQSHLSTQSQTELNWIVNSN